MPFDVAVVGAGAAGLATAIFVRRQNPDLRVALFEGKHRPGAKILISGGGRCNVTNTEVVASDFNGGTPAAIAMVLRAFPVADTIAFFGALGVPLREEPGGKLFPVSNRARDVLDALLREARQTGVDLRAGDRVNDLTVDPSGFRITSTHGVEIASTVVVATGGLSVPKTGSDGWGYGIARRLGHTIVPTTPALVPLVFGTLDGGKSENSLDAAAQRQLSGVSHPVRLDFRVNGRIERRITGPMLWTHVGISGPAALDVSRHWLRGGLEERPVSLTASLCPDDDFDSLEHAWLALARDRPRLGVASALAQSVPRAIADVILAAHPALGERTIAALSREERRHLVHTLLEWPLPISGSRGFTHAEVTAGGVALAEISPRTMESRIQPRLYFVGEVLDVDGRLGGFNFQWSWASAKVAAACLGQGPASGGMLR